MIKQIGRIISSPFLSYRTALQAWYVLEQLVTRLKVHVQYWGVKNLKPKYDKLHFGCGSRKVDGWLNVDLAGSDFNLDLSAGYLPWKDNAFVFAVSQHVVEHLELTSELIPLLKEIQRTLKPGGEIWLSTPDMEKICRAYLAGQMGDMIADRNAREPDWELGDIPPTQMVNVLFHQNGEHKNLFDFTLLKWALERSGFEQVCRVRESALLERFPGFPPRQDDIQSLYVRAVVVKE